MACLESFALAATCPGVNLHIFKAYLPCLLFLLRQEWEWWGVPEKEGGGRRPSRKPCSPGGFSREHGAAQGQQLEKDCTAHPGHHHTQRSRWDLALELSATCLQVTPLVRAVVWLKEGLWSDVTWILLEGSGGGGASLSWLHVLGYSMTLLIQTSYSNYFK
jgi:hypothetical protein